MLVLAEQARQERAASTDPILIPRGCLTMLLRVMKVRDPSIILHGQRIAAISSGVAQLLGWDDAQRRQLEIAALLHDLGKIGVPDHILRKPGKLSSEEYDLVTLHHNAAVNLLQVLHADDTLVSVLAQLHQNFDGAGIETIKAGIPKDLPLGPRILAVADAYDSLSSPKAYRRGMTHEEVMKILTEQSGSRYDGNVVRTLDRWFKADGDSLFSHSDPFQDGTAQTAVSEDQCNEMVVLTQILHILYQFQLLYDGYFIIDGNNNYCVWSTGMLGLTEMTHARMMGRNWQPTDVRLSAVTQTARNASGPEEEIIVQVLRNGRSQFGSRICHVNETEQLSVDVYTQPIGHTDGKTIGAIQMFRCKGGVRRQTKEYAELKLAATRDALTGVANRGQLETQLRHLLDDFHNHEATRSLSVVFLDVDKFKNINDTYGHKAGDQVLIDLTRLLQHETYSGEVIARYGGEEFVLLCPDTDLQAAVRRAERLRIAIVKSSVGGVASLNVTSSFGVSTARLGDSVQTVLERADTALYKAKETGRNKTCWENQDSEEVEIESDPTEEITRVTRTDEGFQFTDSISVSTSLELTAMKLNAFLTVAEVDIKHQEHGHLILQTGKLGFTRRWGTTAERQPIDIDIKFESSRSADTGAGESKTRRFVVIVIKPVGKVSEQAIFELRCVRLIQQLKSYLLTS